MTEHVQLSHEDIQSLLSSINKEAAQEENGATIKSMQKEWEVIDITAEGLIVRTPTGVFRYQEDSKGRLLRLERLFEDESH